MMVELSAREEGQAYFNSIASLEKQICQESSTVSLTGESRVFFIDSIAGKLPGVGLGPPK